MSKRSRKAHRMQRWAIVPIQKWIADELAYAMRVSFYNRWLNGE